MSPNDLNNQERNPGQVDANRRFSDNPGTHNNPISDGSVDGVSPNQNRDQTLDREESAQNNQTSGIRNNVEGRSPQSQGSRAQRFRGAIKRNKGKSATAGVLGGFGIIGILFTLIAPSSLLISLTENLLSTNNGAETAYERRITKVLGSKLSDQDGLCNTKRVSCKMGRISTNGLKKLEAKGVFALDSAGNELSQSNGKYPDRQIARYRVDGFENTIPTGQMKSFLANEPKLAAKLLGRSGAFNIRFEILRGKYFNKTFYQRWKNISRTGGTADGENRRNATPAQVLEKLREKVPGADTLTTTAEPKIRAKTDALVEQGKRGGVGYLAAVSGCIGVKAPGMIAGAVASVQVARTIPLASDLILSPGTKNKASLTSNISPEDVTATTSTLTATDANGKSALDSEYLKSAIGVNTNKTGPSKDFSPGYSLLTNPFIRNVKEVEGDNITQATCNTVLSPQAMYTAIAVDSAVTVAANATLIGGIAKVGASFIIGEVVGRVVSNIAADQGAKVIGELAQNDKLDKVIDGQVGEPLGDALGVSSMIFFSSSAAARHTPVLKQSQLAGFSDAVAEQAEYQKQIDIASLSPFDISSKNTFLGGIVHNVNTAALTHGGYNASFLSSFALSPLNFLSSTVSADSGDSSVNYCSYAEDFGMETGNDLTPAVNAAGLPCYGYSGNISSESAVATAERNNWISQDVDEEADLEQIAETDSRLSDYLIGCGSGSIDNGTWTETAAGCTIDTASSPSKAVPANLAECTEEDGDDCFSNSEGVKPTQSTSSTAQESEAVAAFAMDYQLSQAIDGFDEEEFSSASSSDDSSDSPTAGGKIEGDDYAKECGRYTRFYGGICNRQCVSFVLFRLLKHDAIDSVVFGNGKDVVTSLGKRGFKTDKTPAVNSVFSTSQTSQPQFGHTGMVSKVNKDGSIVVEEYNFQKPLNYATRTVSKAEYQAKGYTFAHTETKYQ